MRLLFLGLALIMSGGVGAVVLSRRRRLADWTFGFLVALGAGTGLLAAARVLGGGTSRAVTIHPGLPGGPWVAGIDDRLVYVVEHLARAILVAIVADRVQLASDLLGSEFVVVMAVPAGVLAALDRNATPESLRRLIDRALPSA